LGADPVLGILNPLTLDPGWKTGSGNVARVKKYMDPGILILFHPESVMEKSGSRINMPDPQHIHLGNMRAAGKKVRNGSGYTARARDPDPYQYKNTMNKFFPGHL
jgi:hypothetical protein